MMKWTAPFWRVWNSTTAYNAESRKQNPKSNLARGRYLWGLGHSQLATTAIRRSRGFCEARKARGGCVFCGVV